MFNDFYVILSSSCVPGQHMKIKLLSEMLVGLAQDAWRITQEKIEIHIENFVELKDPRTRSDLAALILAKLSGRRGARSWVDNQITPLRVSS